MPSSSRQRDELIAMERNARFNEPKKAKGMKLRLGVAIILVPLIAHAEEGDRQSMYIISSTTPVTLTSASTRSALLPNGANWRGVRIVATQAAHCRAGDVTVTATANDTLFPANAPEYMKVQPSDGNYVACIRDTADGKVWIDPVKQ